MSIGETVKGSPAYLHGRLWKTQITITRIGWREFNVCKHYDRRPVVGAPWQYVKSTCYQVARNPHF